MDDSEAEDELSSPSFTSLRVTPRQATKRSASEALGNNDTPYTNLRKLASTIRATSTTPNDAQRAPSVGAASDSRLGGDIATLRKRGVAGVGKYPRPVPAKRSAPSTPHAIRALEQRRRAALTPSRERRRSGRQQRDSPRDILRNLSKVLAAKIKPPSPKAPPVSQAAGAAESDDEDELQDDERSRPRLSLPIEDDSLELPPPETSALDEDITQRSIETSRRAVTEPFLRERSRLSEGPILTPDQKPRLSVGGSLRGAASPGISIVIDDSMIQNDRQGDDTQDLRRMVFEERDESAQDESMQDNQVPDVGFDDSTFRFDIPLDLQQADQADELGLALQTEEVEDDNEVASDSQVVSGLVEGIENFLAESDHEQEAQEAVASEKAKSPLRRGKRQKVMKKSRYGIPVPSLPTGVVKSIANSFASSSGRSRRKINKDILAALMQATDWYFEQLGEDLSAYSKHARRKTIDEADVIALMKRQRLISATSTPFSLAQKFLPRELAQEMRMAPPKDEVEKSRGRRKKDASEESEGESE